MPVDGRDDVVVPAEHLARVGVEELERFGHDIDRQRACEIATDLRMTGRPHRVDATAGHRVDPAREAVPGLGREEGLGERVAMAVVLVTVEREHARADDLRRREAGVVDGETGRIAHDGDTQVTPRHEPAVEHGHP